MHLPSRLIVMFIFPLFYASCEMGANFGSDYQDKKSKSQRISEITEAQRTGQETALPDEAGNGGSSNADAPSDNLQGDVQDNQGAANAGSPLDPIPDKTAENLAALNLNEVVIPGSDCNNSLSGFRPDHLRVSFQENPAHEAYISWSTGAAGTNHWVAYDVVSHRDDLRYAGLKNVTTSGTYESGNHFYHHAFLENLAPDTTYYFIFISDQDRSQEFHFKTAPDAGQGFQFFGGGDSRSDLAKRTEMNGLISTLYEQRPAAIALLHGGDFVSDGANFADWNCWLVNHQATTTNVGRVLPVIATRGNHEKSPQLFSEIWGFSGGGNHYFTTEIENLAIITLNSNIALEGDQSLWLESELARLAKSKTWITANYHQPAFPAEKSPGGTLQAFVPLFDQYRVDMVFESDGHVLKKTVPIRFGKLDEIDGTIYVGEGGLGVGQRAAKKSGDWYFQGPGAYAKSGYHVQLVTIDRESLNFEVIDDNGQTVAADGFTLTAPRIR
jgi:acid phosphatase type 7